MIVGTAGHIDHGKTALVKALTGVDADRLAEEKARGITIELGFAYADLGGGAVTGFVDVPGHERLIHTMLAGAGGIDLALLVVAAPLLLLIGPWPYTLLTHPGRLLTGIEPTLASTNPVEPWQLLLGRGNLVEKMRRYIAIYDKTLKDQITNIARIDLRYANGLAVGWREPVAPTTAQPAVAKN